MRRTRMHAWWMVPGLLLTLLASPALAQEEEKEKEKEKPPEQAEAESPEPPQKTGTMRPGRFFVEGEFWYAQPAGTEYFVATERDPSTSIRNVMDVGYSAAWQPRYRFGYVFENNAGEIIGTYFSEDQTVKLVRSKPGNFVYAEIQAFPLYGGLFDDGLADAFSALTRTRLREWRADFARPVIDAPRVKAKWFVGWREVNHERDLEVDYFALNPPANLFPPLLPPPDYRADLVPNPDSVVSTSTYSAHGPEVGMELLFPVGKTSKFSIEAGVAIALLRGNVASNYSSFTYTYVRTPPGEPTQHLSPPFDFSNDPTHEIKQITFPVGLHLGTAQTNGSALDTYIGLRWKPWKTLEAFMGFRSKYYDKAGADIRPETFTVSPAGIVNFETQSQKNLSVVYEGFYTGVAFTF